MVYREEAKLLRDHGVEVVEYSVRNDSFDQAGALRKLSMTGGMLWSWTHYRRLRSLIREEAPDLVHVHTFFPLLSPSILAAAHRSGVKVVATLHDTRFICPCATSLRNGQICNACRDGHYLRMVKYRCFKNSRLQSLLVAGIFRFHHARKTFYREIDRYICLNDTQMKLLQDAGYDRSKLVKKVNFVRDCSSSGTENSLADELKLPLRYAVFYGRLGEEKGIRDLMKIWDGLEDIPLVVMGDGPLRETFVRWTITHKQVKYLGYTPHEQCLQIVRGAEFVIFSSIWYEGCSMVEIESESLGKAILAYDIGFSAEAIRNGVNGYKIPLGNTEAFTAQIRALWQDEEACRAMGLRARLDYEKTYRPEENFRQLMKIYQDVIG